MEAINLIMFISIYLFARMGMKLMMMVLFEEDQAELGTEIP